MKRSLKEYSRLPTIPTVAMRILQVFDDPETSMQDVVDIVKTDPAIASKIVRAVNSAQFGSWGEVTDLKRAVMLLGKNTVTPLVLGFSLSQDMTLSPEHTKTYEKIWFRCVAQAISAELLAKSQKSPSFTAECFLTNLLANVGALALMKLHPEEYEQTLTRADNDPVRLLEIQHEVFGFSEKELTITLLENFQVPVRCINALRPLFEADFSLEREDDNTKRLSQISDAANAVERFLCDQTRGVDIIRLDEKLSLLGNSDETATTELLDALNERLAESADLFNLDPAKLPNSSELLAEALEQLAEFSSAINREPESHEVPETLLEENGELKRRVKDLVRLANTDALTGVYARGYYDQQIREAIAIAQIREQPLGLAVIDIDFFKQVNDTHGHQAGDVVLREVAQALQGVLRDKDIIARFGGEEFVAILNGAELDFLEIIGERLRKTVEKLDIVHEKKRIPVTVSVGLSAGLPPEDAVMFAKELFSIADASLYQAKNSGRNCVVTDSYPTNNVVGTPHSAVANSRRLVPAEL